MGYDFDWVTPRLATGSQINGQADLQELVACGVTAIIDCTTYQERVGAETPGMRYLWNPTRDDGEPKPVSWFAISLGFALPILTQPRERVLAHCQSGIDRGPSTIYAILRALGWDGTDAVDLIHRARPETCDGIAYAGDADHAITLLGFD